VFPEVGAGAAATEATMARAARVRASLTILAVVLRGSQSKCQVWLAIWKTSAGTWWERSLALYFSRVPWPPCSTWPPKVDAMSQASKTRVTQHIDHRG
jgi:hypothetical protein